MQPHLTHIEHMPKAQRYSLAWKQYLPIVLLGIISAVVVYNGLYVSYAHPHIKTDSTVDSSYIPYAYNYSQLDTADAEYARKYPCSAVERFGCELLPPYDILRTPYLPYQIWSALNPTVTGCTVGTDGWLHYDIDTGVDPEAASATSKARCNKATVKKASLNITTLYTPKDTWTELVRQHTEDGVVVTEEMLRDIFPNNRQYYLSNVPTCAEFAFALMTEYLPKYGVLDTDTGILHVFSSDNNNNNNEQGGWVHICAATDAEYQTMITVQAEYKVAYTVDYKGITIAGADKSISQLSRAFILGHIGAAFAALTAGMCLIAVVVLCFFNASVKRITGGNITVVGGVEGGGSGTSATTPIHDDELTAFLPPRMPLMHYYRMRGLMITTSVFAVVALLFIFISCIVNVTRADISCRECNVVTTARDATSAYLGLTITGILTAAAMAFLSIYTTVKELW